jgi:hypothetical protein
VLVEGHVVVPLAPAAGIAGQLVCVRAVGSAHAHRVSARAQPQQRAKAEKVTRAFLVVLLLAAAVLRGGQHAARAALRRALRRRARRRRRAGPRGRLLRLLLTAAAVLAAAVLVFRVLVSRLLAAAARAAADGGALGWRSSAGSGLALGSGGALGGGRRLFLRRHDGTHTRHTTRWRRRGRGSDARAQT